MPQFTKKHAEAIADKLGCSRHEAKAHTQAELFHNGKMVAHFGIRRGSGEVGHDYLPSELHLRQKECRELYDCALTKDGYLQILSERGLLK